MNEKRNWKIYFEWIEGKDYKILAAEFGLAQSTIKDICVNKVPPKVRSLPWQTVNQYRRWREFARQNKTRGET